MGTHIRQSPRWIGAGRNDCIAENGMVSSKHPLIGEAGIKISEETGHHLNAKEKELAKLVTQFPEILGLAAKEMNPALIANYCYELAREYNQFYHDFSILSADTEQDTQFRLLLSEVVCRIISKGMGLLGIDMPERM